MADQQIIEDLDINRAKLGKNILASLQKSKLLQGLVSGGISSPLRAFAPQFVEHIKDFAPAEQTAAKGLMNSIMKVIDEWFPGKTLQHLSQEETDKVLTEVGRRAAPPTAVAPEVLTHRAGDKLKNSLAGEF